MKRRRFLSRTALLGGAGVCGWTPVGRATAGDRAADPEAAPDRVRVMSYNIYAGRNQDDSYDLQRVADVILAGRPDLVALQEVDVNTARSSRRDLGSELAELTGMKVSFGPAMDYQGGQYGNAVLSRWPIAGERTHSLPGNGGEPRSGAEALVAVPGLEQPLSLVSLHIDHRSHELREKQLRVLDQSMEDEGWSLRLVVGDYNAEPDSELMVDRLGSGDWIDLAPPEARETPTFSSDRPRRRIDYIIAAAPFDHEVTDYAVGPQMKPDDEDFAAKVALASDHMPLVAEFKL